MLLFKTMCHVSGNGGEIQWCFSQVKGTMEDDITEGKVFFRNYFGAEVIVCRVVP